MPTLEPKSLKAGLPKLADESTASGSMQPSTPSIMPCHFLQHVHIETLKHSETHLLYR